MKHILAGLLSSAAVFAVATPALAVGNGGDANGEANQAQFHPLEANQTPDWAPGRVAVGELYPAVRGEHAFLWAKRGQADRDGGLADPVLPARL